MSGDPSDQRNSATAGNWQFVKNPSGQEIPRLPVSIAEPFPPGFWKHPAAALQNPGFSANAAIVSNAPMFDMGWNASDPTIPRMGMLPPSLSDFSADSSFIDRAARFSSFRGDNNLGSMPNPFATSASKNVSTSIDHGSKSDNPMRNQRDCVVSEEESPDLPNVSGNSSSKGLGAMKRKKTHQGMELDKGASQFSGESSKENVVTIGKSRGKNAKGSTDAGKDDYIHVRARSGQATKSHSLAERVRRERISERMKYLQDLVPGCSKVTGKAVMLDEIINYVQSLQRQVEFLSMKLATVNPCIDFNIEGLLSKDQLFQSHASPSTMGFSQELIHQQLLASQHGLVQTGNPGTVNQSDALRRAINAQFAMVNGFKEPATQLQESWEAEIQNVIQMSFGANPHPNIQESNK